MLPAGSSVETTYIVSLQTFLILKKKKKNQVKLYFFADFKNFFTEIVRDFCRVGPSLCCRSRVYHRGSMSMNSARRPWLNPNSTVQLFDLRSYFTPLPFCEM